MRCRRPTPCNISLKTKGKPHGCPVSGLLAMPARSAAVYTKNIQLGGNSGKAAHARCALPTQSSRRLNSGNMLGHPSIEGRLQVQIIKSAPKTRAATPGHLGQRHSLGAYNRQSLSLKKDKRCPE